MEFLSFSLTEWNCDEKCDGHTVIREDIFLHEFELGIVWIVNPTTGMNELKTFGASLRYPWNIFEGICKQAKSGECAPKRITTICSSAAKSASSQLSSAAT
jgi:hypothetical protein